MIDTGSSLIDTAQKLKKRGAEHIYLMSTFALFSQGIGLFKIAYQKGLFDKIYSTNLSYVPEEYLDMPWLESVDCSLKVANIIDNLNNGRSIKELLDDKKDTAQKIKTLTNRSI